MLLEWWQNIVQFATVIGPIITDTWSRYLSHYQTHIQYPYQIGAGGLWNSLVTVIALVHNKSIFFFLVDETDKSVGSTVWKSCVSEQVQSRCDCPMQSRAWCTFKVSDLVLLFSNWTDHSHSAWYFLFSVALCRWQHLQNRFSYQRLQTVLSFMLVFSAGTPRRWNLGGGREVAPAAANPGRLQVHKEPGCNDLGYWNSQEP